MRPTVPSLFTTAVLAAACGARDALPEREIEVAAKGADAARPRPILPSLMSTAEAATPALDAGLRVESTAFPDGGLIPVKYTADGDNVSPPLSWSDGPPATQSYAVIVDDPGTAYGTWVHWITWDIPATRLPEAIPGVPVLPNNQEQGRNSWKKVGYGGPQPPVGAGMHTYYFRVYALDVRLELPPERERRELEDAMRGHVLASGVMTGRYQRVK